MTMTGMIALSVWTLLVFFIGYYIGRWHGFEEGREHELDKVARRHERMKRFSTGGYDQ